MSFSQSYSSALAPRPTKNDPRIDKLKGDIEYVSQQEAKEIKDYLQKRAEAQKAAADLAAVNKKIADAESRKKAAQDEAAKARAEFAAAQQRYDLALEESKKAKDLRRSAIVRLYQESLDDDAMPSILSASPEQRQDVVRASTLLKKYNDVQGDVLVEAEKKAKAAEEEKLLYEDARLRAEEAEKTAADEEAALEPLRKEAAQAQKIAKDLELKEKAVVDSLKSKKAEYNRQIAKIVAESNALAQQIRNNQNTTIVVQPGRMRRPVSAAITSPFGMRTHPIYGDARLHAGIDFGASYGAAIGAAKNGKVIYAGTMSGYGNVIIVDHGGGISTLYAHMSSFAVSLGSTVTQGQTIGYVGASGQVTGAHLHFEVRSNGSPVDPMGYF